MKFFKRCLVLNLVMFISGFALSSERTPLADIYRTGKARFVQELAVDETSLPKDVVLAGPAGLECDPAGNLYILDFSDNNIKQFDASGKFLRVIGRKGQGPGEFSMPIALAFAKDRLVVWDMGNNRVCALSPSGELLNAENAASYSGRPSRLAALPTGEIVLETEKTYFSEPDRPQDRFLEILSPDLKPQKTVYTQAVLRNKYMRNGGTMWNIPQPFGPDIHWSVSPAGDIVVGFSEKYDVSVLDKSGAKRTAFAHSYEPVKVTAEDEKSFFDGMTSTTGSGGVKRGAPDFIVKNTAFPRFKPAFSALVVDSEGNILVHPFRKNKDEMYRYFDAFDPGGKFLATVRIEGDVPFPGAQRISRVVDGRFWLVKYGDDELPHIIMYRISG